MKHGEWHYLTLEVNITEVKTLWYWKKDRHIDRWNKKKVKKYKYGQLTSSKVQRQFSGEWRVFSTNGVGTTG